VTIDPSTDRVNGRVQAGINSVYNCAQLGTACAGINVPLSDTWAVRASGSIDAILLYRQSLSLRYTVINKGQNNGYAAAADWRAVATVRGPFLEAQCGASEQSVAWKAK